MGNGMLRSCAWQDEGGSPCGPTLGPENIMLRPLNRWEQVRAVFLGMEGVWKGFQMLRCPTQTESASRDQGRRAVLAAFQPPELRQLSQGTAACRANLLRNSVRGRPIRTTSLSLGRLACLHLLHGGEGPRGELLCCAGGTRKRLRESCALLQFLRIRDWLGRILIGRRMALVLTGEGDRTPGNAKCVPGLDGEECCAGQERGSPGTRFVGSRGAENSGVTLFLDLPDFPMTMTSIPFHSILCSWRWS